MPVTVSECAPIGNGADRSPPWAATSARNRSIAVPSRSVSAGSTPSTPASVEHLAGQRQRQLHDVVGAAAGEHLQRLGDLDRVADRAAQRDVHVGQQRPGGHAVRRAELDHGARPARATRPRSSGTRPEPTLTSSTSASAPSASFLLMTELAISGSDSVVAVTSRSA